MSWDLPSKISAKVTGPSAPTSVYSGIWTIGSRRRCAAIASSSRVAAFSRIRSSAELGRATSSASTTGGKSGRVTGAWSWRPPVDSIFPMTARVGCRACVGYVHTVHMAACGGVKGPELEDADDEPTGAAAGATTTTATFAQALIDAGLAGDPHRRTAGADPARSRPPAGRVAERRLPALRRPGQPARRRQAARSSTTWRRGWRARPVISRTRVGPAAARLRAVGLGYIDFAVAEPGWFEVAFTDTVTDSAYSATYAEADARQSVAAAAARPADGGARRARRVGSAGRRAPGRRRVAVLVGRARVRPARAEGPLRGRTPAELRAAAERTVDVVIAGLLAPAGGSVRLTVFSAGGGPGWTCVGRAVAA